MIIILKRGCDDEDIDQITETLEDVGYGAHVSRGEERTIVGAVGTEPHMRERLMEKFRGFPCVDRVIPVLKPYKLVSKESQDEPTAVDVGGVKVGRGSMTVIAGPCAVESEEQTVEAAKSVAAAGARILRGGAFKPRTSPYDFQGLGEDGLQVLATAREETGLPVVTEARSLNQIPAVIEYADMIQIGARNMQNFDLLKEAGRSGMPVMLKRGFASTIEEWLKAAEYIASTGNLNIILCERGIRTFGTEVRFTQDLSAVAVVQKLSHLPIIVDPSHASGDREVVPAVTRAAVAVGADGLMIEVHPDPEGALCDGPQQLRFSDFETLMDDVRCLCEALDKEM